MILLKFNPGFAGCFFLLLVGCELRDSRVEVEIYPPALDLGMIAATGQQVDATFLVKNKSKKELRPEVIPSCSCTVISKQKLTIEPNQSSDIRISISTQGRSGEFATQISVIADGTNYEIPIKASFVPQVFAFPSRVVFYPSTGAQGGYLGQVTIEAPLELWPELELQGDSSFSIEGETEGRARRFRVLYKGPHRVSHPPILLRRKDQALPVLTIPAISGTL